MEHKPKFRGRIHQAAFYLTISESILYILSWSFFKGNLGICIYLLAQLILFGVSSTYHITDWKNEKAEHIVRLLDHISIFLLISGTQTSVVLTLLPYNAYTKSILLVSWSITTAGVLKIVLLRRLNHLFDTVVYILHGVSVVPFFKIMFDSLSICDLIFIIVGGIVYVLGGVVYGSRKPDPYPYIFGYHEVFHAATVIANYCFFIPLLKNYVGSIQVSM